MKNKNCLNCDTKVMSNFCENCGQKLSIKPFTIKYLFEEIFHAFTHADKSILKYTGQLIVKPGIIAKEYIHEGKRKKYFNPFTYFLIITALSGFVGKYLLNLNETVFQYGNEYGMVMNQYVKIFLILNVLLFSVITSIIFIKKGSFKFAEYFVLGVIFFSSIQSLEVLFDFISIIILKLWKIDFRFYNYPIYPIFIAFFYGYQMYIFKKETLTNSASNIIKYFGVGIMTPLISMFIAMFIVLMLFNNFQGLGIFSYYGITWNTR